MNNDVPIWIEKYYKQIDFNIWQTKAYRAFSKISTYKRQKNKSPYVIDLFSTYIQVSEILLINLAAVLSGSDNGFIARLFITNKDLRDLIKKNLYKNDVLDETLIKSILLDYVFSFNDKSQISNLEEKISIYTLMIKESINDYFEYYEFLNAYKHGYRVQASGRITLTLKGGVNSQSLQIGDYNSSITYYSKAGEIIIENIASFNYERIYQKITYVLNIMICVQKTVLARFSGEPYKLEHLEVVDKNEFHKYFGSLHFPNPIFQIKNSPASNTK